MSRKFKMQIVDDDLVIFKGTTVKEMRKKYVADVHVGGSLYCGRLIYGEKIQEDPPSFTL